MLPPTRSVAEAAGRHGVRGIVSVGRWRTHDGQEVDLVIEHSDGAVTAFEVKAAGPCRSQ